MGQIKVTPCDIDGLYIIEPTVHGDSRGYFMETYNQNDMHEAGLDMVFVQDNQSSSSKGVLRGLHFQKDFRTSQTQNDHPNFGVGRNRRHTNVLHVLTNHKFIPQ